MLATTISGGYNIYMMFWEPVILTSSGNNYLLSTLVADFGLNPKAEK
jgi:hypothetical protein